MNPLSLCRSFPSGTRKHEICWTYDVNIVHVAEVVGEGGAEKPEGAPVPVILRLVNGERTPKALKGRSATVTDALWRAPAAGRPLPGEFIVRDAAQYDFIRAEGEERKSKKRIVVVYIVCLFSVIYYKKRKSVLGVDIGSSSLKVVQLRKEGGQAVLETYGELALGPYGGGEIDQATFSPPNRSETLKDLCAKRR